MSIKRNTLYNLAGAIIPLATALVVTPLFLDTIGAARYGILALVWLTLGYFGLFDLGLANAATNSMARDRASGGSSLGRILVSALAANLALGLAIGALLWFVAPALVDLVEAPAALKTEVLAAVPWLALCIPIVTMGGVFTAVLASHERFGLTTVIGVGGTVMFQVVPLIVALTLSPSLAVIVPAALVARVVPVLATAVIALREVPAGRSQFHVATLRDLLSYGGWVMVTKVVSPVLASIDQFAIGAVLGAVSVAHYSVGYALASKLLVLPGAVTQSIFPRLSALDEPEARRLASGGAELVAVILVTVSIPAVLLARPFISWWIDPAFGQAAGPVAAVLLLAIAVNGACYVPFIFLHARRRPKVTALFHLAETIPFFAALWIGMATMGLVGAALAWLFRVALDGVLLFWASRLGARWVVFALALLALVTLSTFVAPGLSLPIGSLAFALCGWRCLVLLRPHVPLLQRVPLA